MFKSPMATFSKELEAIRNVPVHPLSAAAWWLTYGYCMLKSLCVRHACTRRRVQARLCARQRAAFVLAFSLFLFVIVNDRFWECLGNRRRKKRRKDIWKMICLSFVQKFSASYQRSRGDLSDYLALRRLSKMNACTVRVRNRSRRRRISKRWKKQL